jgi:hypothetical protein
MGARPNADAERSCRIAGAACKIALMPGPLLTNQHSFTGFSPINMNSESDENRGEPDGCQRAPDQ